MSGNYTKVPVVKSYVKTYGFQKVSEDEIIAITNRVNQHTITSKLSIDALQHYQGIRNSKYNDARGEYRGKHPLVNINCLRDKEAAKKWSESDRFFLETGKDNATEHPNDSILGNRPKTAPASTSMKLSRRQLEKLLERLEQPTLSREVAMAGSYFKEPFDEEIRQGRIIRLDRPYSAPERKRALQRIQRPTTANLGKRVGVCPYCDDDRYDIDRDLFNADYCDGRIADEDELSGIIERAQTPTHASRGGTVVCKKAKSDRYYLYHRREPLTEETKEVTENLQSSQKRKKPPPEEPLPLLSGLPRSKNVDEIVRRLYQPKRQVTYPPPRWNGRGR